MADQQDIKYEILALLADQFVFSTEERKTLFSSAAHPFCVPLYSLRERKECNRSMIQLPETKLFIGDINDLQQTNNQEWAIIHATQTIHYKLFGWNRTTNKPNRDHPNYIVFEKDNILSLNWVDGPPHLYKWSGAETFIKVLDFIEKWHHERNVLIHCDQGLSRSPTIGLLFLAKRAGSIPNDTFKNAKNSFMEVFPYYMPGGIGDYVSQIWNDLR